MVEVTPPGGADGDGDSSSGSSDTDRDKRDDRDETPTSSTPGTGGGNIRDPSEHTGESESADRGGGGNGSTGESETQSDTGGTEQQEQQQGRELTEQTGRQRFQRESLRNEAADQAEGVEAQDVTLQEQDGRVTGATANRRTRGDLEILASQQVAARNENVDPGDVNVTVQEDTFVSGGDARLAQEAGTDGDDLRQPTFNIELSEDARRDMLRDRAEEQYPDAQDVDIVEEDGQLQAEVTRQSASDEFISGIENAVRNPETIDEGAVETFSGAADRGAAVGQNAVDTVTNPRETAGEVGEFVDSGTTGLERNVSSFVDDPTGEIGEAANERVEEGRQSLSEIQGFASETAERASESRIGQAAVASAPVAAAEPTPLGEIGVGGALAGVTIGTAGAVGIERATSERSANVEGQETDLDRSGVTGITGTEIDVPAGREPVQESEIGTPQGQPGQQSEIGTPERGANVGGEIDAPEGTEPVEPTEVQVPEDSGTRNANDPLQTSPVTIGETSQRQEEEDPRTITDEDLVSDLPEPDQAPPSTRERMRRDDLTTPGRTFPTGESAVVGRGAQERAEEAQSRDVTDSIAEESIDVGARTPAVELPVLGVDVAADTAQTPATRPSAVTQPTAGDAALGSATATQTTSTATNANLQANAPGLANQYQARARAQTRPRPRLPELGTGGSSDDDDEGVGIAEDILTDFGDPLTGETLETERGDGGIFGL